MRKLTMLLAIVACTALTAPQLAHAAPKPTEQELLVKKKMKAEADRKAAAKKKKLEEKRKADAAKKATARKLAAEKQTDRRKIVQTGEPRRRMVNARKCGDFLDCLFGKKDRPAVRRVSAARTTDYDGGYDRETGEVISWSGAAKYSPGTIVVNTPERALYLVEGNGMARRYKVGVGREGFQWSGNAKISNKAEWPTWRPPQSMIEREAAKGNYLPDMMEGGPENPLGARALYIGGTLYRIHGTNNAASIGGAVSSGCIRMMNADVIDLYERVQVGARVYVYQ